jgi:hypothetical protein
MAKMSIQTIKADPPTGKPLGSRSDVVLKSLFKTSPLYTAQDAQVEGQGTLTLTPEAQKQWFIDHVVNGVVPDSGQYYGFDAPVSVDFTGDGASVPGGPPDLTKVTTGGGGLPSTPYTPNPASPGEGNGVNAATVPESKDFADFINSKKPSNFGSGASVTDSSRNPINSSKAMKTSLGQFLGKSPASTNKP